MNHTAEKPAATEAPQHEHNCSCCVFLGNAKDGRDLLDLYVHTAVSPTVLARWGSAGPEYFSGLSASYGTGPLLEARIRAQQLSLIPYDVYEAMHYASSERALAEVRAALPFTVEYQAWLALSVGNVTRSQGLATHLLNLERARKSNKVRSGEICLIEIESRLSRILLLMAKSGERTRFDDAEAVTEFLWNTLSKSDAWKP